MTLAMDWVNQQILIQSPQTTVQIQDLINFIREQESSIQGITASQITEASGKEDLGNSVAVGITINLRSPWQLKFWAGSYTAIISGGNLVGGLGGSPVAYTAGVQVLIIQSAASTVVTTSGGTGSGLTTDEHNKLYAIANAVPAVAPGSLNGLLTYGTGNGQILPSGGNVNTSLYPLVCSVGSVHIDGTTATFDILGYTGTPYVLNPTGMYLSVGSLGAAIPTWYGKIISGTITGSGGTLTLDITDYPLPFPFDWSFGYIITSKGGTSSGGVVTGYATGQDPATLVLDALATDHNTTGTIGQKVNTGGSGGSSVVSGYATGQDPATLLLANPSNKLLTDSSGKVSLASGEHTAIVTDTQGGMTAQGYTTTRAGYLDVLNGIVTAIWNATTRTLSAFGFNVTASSVTDKTGYSLTTGEHTNITSDIQSAMTSQGYTPTRAGYLDYLTKLPIKPAKNQALPNFTFVMRDALDHITPIVGRTVVASRNLDGVGFSLCANTVTEIGNGWYKIDLTAADMNGNSVSLMFTAAGADSRNIVIFPQNP